MKQLLSLFAFAVALNQSSPIKQNPADVQVASYVTQQVSVLPATIKENDAYYSTCSFSMQPGFGTPTNGIFPSSGSVSFYLVFYPTSSAMSPGIYYTIARIIGPCTPSVNRTLTSSSGSGRTWEVIIDTGGFVSVKLLSGSAVPINFAINISGSYNL